MEISLQKVVVIGPPDTFELVEDYGAEVAGYLSIREEKRSTYLQYRYLGTDDHIPELINEGYSFAIALKDNLRRRQLIEQIVALRGVVVLLRHSSATVFKTTEVGVGAVIAPQSVVSAFAKVGSGVVVNYGSLVGHDVELGNWSFVAPGVKLLGYCKVGENAVLGTNSVVFPYVTIGNNVTIAANAVITKNVPDNFTVLPISKFRYIEKEIL